MKRLVIAVVSVAIGCVMAASLQAAWHSGIWQWNASDLNNGTNSIQVAIDEFDGEIDTLQVVETNIEARTVVLETAKTNLQARVLAEEIATTNASAANIKSGNLDAARMTNGLLQAVSNMFSIISIDGTNYYLKTAP